MNVSGVTTDSAQVTVNSDRITLRMRRRDGSGFTLNTVDHLVESDTGISPVTGRNWSDGILFDYDANSLTVMRGAVDYADLGDWMAGGYWLHVRGDWDSGQVSGIEVGAFVDGPEISRPANMPVSGTATYNGIAAGLAFTTTGTDVPVPTGTYEALEYSGSFRAVADFGSGTISGTVSNIDGYGYQVYPDGSFAEGYGATPLTLYYGPTPISANGTWSGTTFRAVDPRYTYVTQEGSWGGRFSTIDDRTGDPRLVGGTHGGRIVSSGGTESLFIGAHFGATPNF